MVLFEQMTKLDNLYFELVVYIQLMYPHLSPTGKHSTYPGLILTFAWKIVTVAIEQLFLWYDDLQENVRPFQRLSSSSDLRKGPNDSQTPFQWIRSEYIRQGDFVLLQEGDVVPCDGVAVAASEKMFMIVMATLNGELAPQKRYPLPWEGAIPPSWEFFQNLRGSVECSPPTHILDDFRGKFQLEGEAPLTFDVRHSVYRGTKLKGVEWVLLYCIHPGPLSKLGQNFTGGRAKQSLLDSQFTRLLKFNLGLLGILILLATLVGFLSGKVAFSGTALIVELTANFLQLNGLNNLSSQLLADLVRLGQRLRLSRDRRLCCLVNRKDLLDELVQEVVTDKTGTLTENVLELVALVTPKGVTRRLPIIESISDSHVNQLWHAMALCHDVTTRSSELLASTAEDLKFVTAAQSHGVHLLERSLNHMTIATTSREVTERYSQAFVTTALTS